MTIIDGKVLIKDGEDIKYLTALDVKSNPVMTSTLLPSGLSESSSDWSSTYISWKAFDSLTTTYWIPTTMIPSWISYTFPTAKVIKAYSISAREVDQYEFPSSWKFQGSNDKVNWVDLDSQENFIGFIEGVSNKFRVSNTTAYTTYRLYITSNNGGTYLGIYNIDLFEVNVSIHTAGTQPATKTMFNNYGNSTRDHLDSLNVSNGISSESFEILFMSDESITLEDYPLLNVNYDSNPQLIIGNTLNNYEGELSSLTSTFHIEKSSSIKAVFSEDLENWYGISHTYENSVDSLIPIMTGFNTPSSVLISQSVASYTDGTITYHGWKPFSNLSGNNGRFYIFNQTRPEGGHWIKLKLNDYKAIGGVSFTTNFASGSLSAMKDWEMWGSNNDIDYEKIGEGTTTSTATTQTFSFGNDNRFMYYRINFLDSHYDLTGKTVGVGKIELFESVVTSSSKISVNIENKVDIFQNGLDIRRFESVSSDEWREIITGNNIAFSYIIDEQDSKSKAIINRVDGNVLVGIDTPTLNGLTISYDAVDSNYSGLMFMNEDQEFYSTSLGDILKYLDFGTLVAGQSSLDVKITLMNTYSYPVENINIWGYSTITGLTVQLSKSNNPFNTELSLMYQDVLEPEDSIDFYVRLSTTRQAEFGGNFDIRVKAEPV